MGQGLFCCLKGTTTAHWFQESTRRFRRTELRQATNNFSNDNVIDSGGFGKVYKGVLSDGTKIAVKRRDPGSDQGIREFRTEIELCSPLRHHNVVSLLGYCDEKDEMALVYEYMGQGNLASHLHGSRSRSGSGLTWNQRLKILQGAGRGLRYLGFCSARGIIHLDVKSSNILLDDNLDAKIGDFGLARVGPELGRSHVTVSRVAGTFGYLDPSSFYTRHVRPGSDVYAFAVVLLEALSARKAVDTELPEEQWSLASWAKKILRDDEGGLQGIVDPRIAGEITPDARMMFGELVGKCLEDNPKDRPSMEYVVGRLGEIVNLQQQQAVSPDDDGTPSGVSLGSVIGNSVKLPSCRVQNDGALQAPPKQSSKISRDDRNMPNEAAVKFLAKHNLACRMKLQVEGNETTLVMRDDNLYVHGFMNQQGNCYELVGDPGTSASILPEDYHPDPLSWGGISYKSLLGNIAYHQAMATLAAAKLGRDFAMRAVRRPSSFIKPDDGEVDDLMSTRVALAGLILIVCESARMNPIHNSIADGWITGTGFKKELMSKYVFSYPKMRRRLRDWKQRDYAAPIPYSELRAIYLVLNSPSSPARGVHV